MERVAAHTQSRAEDARRIRTVTRWLLAASLAATGAIGGLAAVHSHASSSSGVSSQPSSDGGSSLTPSSAPQQSVQPPVAQSGGS
jgi:hypothetical protein